MGMNFEQLPSLLPLNCTLMHAQGSLKLANCYTHQKLTFFALQSDVDDIIIMTSRMANIALLYVCNYSCYVNIGY